jgi:integrase/recombinase XerD
LSSEPTAPLFPILRHRKLATRLPLAQANVHIMIQRRTLAASILTRINCHSFRATGITTYLQNGGKREVAQKWPATSQPAQPALTTAAMTP